MQFRYCQVVLKSLKTGPAPEAEPWKQLVLSLEGRIRTHQQFQRLLKLMCSDEDGDLMIDSDVKNVSKVFVVSSNDVESIVGHGKERAIEDDFDD
ncbi:hypothetical protein DEO72_LG2g1917 [Vigna unguiculata]|uniref:Uncharacterized protein n=1 Tax=Vigna unguiculata TaxID=3917 RepID=A0A4D6KV31_VIGUN|nr:hypothetical protein DEO72_LG2g1917 [Vigna unguiculata]